MIMRVYAIFDSKVGAFMQPFYCANRAVALRMFMTAAQDRTTDFNRWPSDFILFEIGEWNGETGKLSSYEVHENLGVASQYLNVEVKGDA